jgi:drug/metabolite transporter (DMT)-like permease
MVPFTAVTLSWIILNEVPSVFVVTGGIIALVATYIINYSNKKTKVVIEKNSTVDK